MPPPSRLASLRLVFRSLFWACLCPGVVALYLPWRFFGVRRVHVAWTSPLHLLGLLLMALGAGVLLTCIRDFARRGRGTLAPVDPPTELVVEGPYRWVRNPMYVGVVTVLLGELALTRSAGLLVYTAVAVVWLHLFVIAYEEPALRRRFGEAYGRYGASVHRWIPAPPRRRTSP